MGVDLEVPSHSIMSRRAKRLGDIKLQNLNSNDPLDILIDSTGVTVHPGNQRKTPKLRDWRKFHAVVDLKSKQIISAQLSSNKVQDATKVKSLVKKIKQPIKSARADSAYDKNKVYKVIEDHSMNHSPRVIVLPMKNAKVSKSSSRERNKNIKSRDRMGSRKWVSKSGYNKRSTIENTFYRYKIIIGPSLGARTFQGQNVELKMGCKILNRMTSLGMPKTSEK